MNKTGTSGEESYNNINDKAHLRRIEVEKYSSIKLNDDQAGKIVDFLDDPDKGVRDAAFSLLVKETNPRIPYMITPLVSSPNFGIRNIAGEILLKKDSSSVKAIQEYLPKCNDDEQKFLIDILNDIGDERASQDILRILRATENSNTKLSCIEAVGNLCITEAIDELLNAYHENRLFKPSVIEALGKIGSIEGLKFIMENFKKADELTKFSMIESLGKIGDEEAFFLILTNIRKVHGPLVWISIESLSLLKERLNLDIPFDENMKNSILKTLIDGENRFKKAAANLIMDYSDKNILDAALEIYGTEFEVDTIVKVKFLKNSVIFYPKLTEIIKQAPPNLLDLLTLLGESILADGGNTLKTISRLEMYNLCDAVAANLNHPDEEIRKFSTELLFGISPQTAILFTDAIIEDRNYWNRLRLLEILEIIDDSSTIEAIKQLADDPVDLVAQRANYILKKKMSVESKGKD